MAELPEDMRQGLAVSVNRSLFSRALLLLKIRDPLDRAHLASALLSRMHLECFPRDAVVADHRVPADRLIVVLEGKISMNLPKGRYDLPGRQLCLHVLGHGDSIGETSVSPYSGWAAADYSGVRAPGQNFPAALFRPPPEAEHAGHAIAGTHPLSNLSPHTHSTPQYRSRRRALPTAKRPSQRLDARPGPGAGGHAVGGPVRGERGLRRHRGLAGATRPAPRRIRAQNSTRAPPPPPELQFADARRRAGRKPPAAAAAAARRRRGM
jgi:hypothetical protein